MLLNQSQSCLVIMDMQEKLFPRMFDAKNLLKSVIQLLKSAVIMDIPVIMTEQNSRGLGSTIYDVREQAGSASVVDKTTFSALGDESFLTSLEILKNTGRTQIVLAGIEEHICILETAFDLRSAGFQPFVVSDSCSCRQIHSKQTAERRIRAAGIDVIDNEMAIYEWLRDSTHPHFKQILEVVK